MKKQHTPKCAGSSNFLHVLGQRKNFTKKPCDCDGYHTFGELYDHRITLFIALCRMMKSLGYKYDEAYDGVWRSKAHHPDDTTMYDRHFIMGVSVDDGQQITYHLPLSRWEETEFALTLDHAPKWDGHSSEDVIERLKKL